MKDLDIDKHIRIIEREFSSYVKRNGNTWINKINRPILIGAKFSPNQGYNSGRYLTEVNDYEASSYLTFADEILYIFDVDQIEGAFVTTYNALAVISLKNDRLKGFGVGKDFESFKDLLNLVARNPDNFSIRSKNKFFFGQDRSGVEQVGVGDFTLNIEVRGGISPRYAQSKFLYNIYHGRHKRFEDVIQQVKTFMLKKGDLYGRSRFDYTKDYVFSRTPKKFSGDKWEIFGREKGENGSYYFLVFKVDQPRGLRDGGGIYYNQLFKVIKYGRK